MMKKDFGDTLMIRELESSEFKLLKDFLYEAIFIPEGVKPPAKEIVERPELRIYYEGFWFRQRGPLSWGRG